MTVISQKQGFTSVNFYFKVQVRKMVCMDCRTGRNFDQSNTTEPQKWLLDCMLTGLFYAAADSRVHLSVKSQAEKLGFFVIYEEGLVSFVVLILWLLSTPILAAPSLKKSACSSAPTCSNNHIRESWSSFLKRHKLYLP